MAVTRNFMWFKFVCFLNWGGGGGGKFCGLKPPTKLGGWSGGKTPEVGSRGAWGEQL